MDIDKYRLIDIQSVWMIILLPPPWGMWSFRLAFLLTVYSHLESAFYIKSNLLNPIPDSTGKFTPLIKPLCLFKILISLKLESFNCHG